MSKCKNAKVPKWAKKSLKTPTCTKEGENMTNAQNSQYATIWTQLCQRKLKSAEKVVKLL